MFCEIVQKWRCISSIDSYGTVDDNGFGNLCVYVMPGGLVWVKPVIENATSMGAVVFVAFQDHIRPVLSIPSAVGPVRRSVRFQRREWVSKHCTVFFSFWFSHTSWECARCECACGIIEQYSAPHVSVYPNIIQFLSVLLQRSNPCLSALASHFAENADGSNSSLPATTPSAPEGPGLSSSDLIVIEVLAAVTLFLVLVLIPISVVILLIVRKKRRLSRDGNGRRVARMVPSERFPTSQVTRAPTQMQNSTNSTTADDHVSRPNVSVDNSKAKFIESFYTFELEVEDDAYDDVIYPCSLDRSEDVVDISLFYERIRTVSKTYGYYEDIGCHTPSLYYYEESLLSNSYEDLSSAMGDSDEDSYDDIVVDVHYVEPPSKENVLMEQIQQMDISRTIKVNDLQ